MKKLLYLNSSHYKIWNKTFCDSSVTRDATRACASVMQYLRDLKNPKFSGSQI